MQRLIQPMVSTRFPPPISLCQKATVEQVFGNLVNRPDVLPKEQYNALVGGPLEVGVTAGFAPEDRAAVGDGLRSMVSWHQVLGHEPG